MSFLAPWANQLALAVALLRQGSSRFGIVTGIGGGIIIIGVGGTAIIVGTDMGLGSVTTIITVTIEVGA